MLTATDLGFWARQASAQPALPGLGGSAATPPSALPAMSGSTQDSIELSVQARLLLGLIQTLNGGQPPGTGPQIYGPPGIRLTAPGAGSLTGPGNLVAVSGPDGSPAVAGVEVDPDSTGTASATTAITPSGGASTEVSAATGDNRINAYALVADRARSASLRVATGGGRDLIAAETTGRLSLEAGAGDDQVAARFGDASEIDLGEGDNLATLTGHFGTVRSGKGHDVIAVQGMGTTVDAGAGNDTVSGAQWVNAGAGRDSITLGNADLSMLVYRRGDGADEITLAPVESGVRPGSARPVIGDESGAIEARAIGMGSWDGFRMDLPAPDEPGHGSAHAALVLRDVTEAEVTARLDGTDLTLTLPTKGDSITIHNYTPGRVSFIFDDRANGGGITGRRMLAGIG
ncbi:hypothetical protein JMJ55_12485 [Belnapia sp. T6]|uniref:Uncharacterized protein n=1 Tax=Belnapia mucosa TaxID=2804532 RepID=A0ABS1V378_9PROT|nr:hypothetical protein [Belnapia mucosa]MBL6456145.1 hypothetical protein [Belnapia mucosa]